MQTKYIVYGIAVSRGVRRPAKFEAQRSNEAIVGDVLVAIVQRFDDVASWAFGKDRSPGTV